jgi:hypothetical protein
MHQQTIRILFENINFCMDFLLDIDGNDDINEDDSMSIDLFLFC